ncbi:MAG: glutathione S-transferase family protein [Alphaproteobacteria bacterium]|nr:glutathione S-transferase family protein [Alphaproteobacteria bacterium]
MIELHQFPAAWGINPSPFCLKVEFYLRLAGIPYRSVVTMPFRAPRGKLPFIVDGGRRIPDSGHIVDHLRHTTTDLDAGLDPQQLALGHLLRRTCEESLYFVLVYARWVDEAGWAVMRPALAAMLPPGLRAAIVPYARRVTRRALHAQGYGRHTPEEIYAMGAADLAAIETLLAGREFAVSDSPTSFDAAVYAVLLSILHPPIETPLKQSAQQHPDLLAYAARIARMLPPPGRSL